jgi:YfiH family protein
MAEPIMKASSFATAEEGVEHFFGTKQFRVDVRPGDTVPPDPLPLDCHRPSAWLSVKQVHGTDVLVIDRPVQTGETFHGGWDALVTNQPDVAVTVRTADCVPVLLYDPEHRVVAAIHAGWRGAVAGIVPKTITALAARFGSRAASLKMAIGPVLAKLREALTDWTVVVSRKTGPNRALVDLRELVRRQAMLDGLMEDHIAEVDTCTICYPDRFYSYRREGVVKDTMVSGIALIPRR